METRGRVPVSRKTDRNRKEYNISYVMKQEPVPVFRNQVQDEGRIFESIYSFLPICLEVS